MCTGASFPGYNAAPGV